MPLVWPSTVLKLIGVFKNLNFSALLPSKKEMEVLGFLMNPLPMIGQKTGDFGIKSGLKILDEAKKKCGKHVFRDDIHNFRAKNIKIFNLNFEKTKKVISL